MDDDDIFSCDFKIIKELFNGAPAQVHVTLRFNEQDRLTGNNALPEKCAETLLSDGNPMLVSQPIQNQETDVVTAELISASRIPETGDQFHKSDPLACSSCLFNSL
jgi:hypothetical protein